jgi:hypothetical protein
VQPMWVQIALNAVTVLADGRARVIGLPACIAAIEPPTGIADSLTSAPTGGTGDGDGRDAGGVAAGGRLAADGGVECVVVFVVVCGVAVCCVAECGVAECGVVVCGGEAGCSRCIAVDRVGPSAVGDVLLMAVLAAVLAGAAVAAPVLAASCCAGVLQPPKASTVTPANPAPPPRTARRLISACSDMMVPSVATTVSGPRSGLPR